MIEYQKHSFLKGFANASREYIKQHSTPLPEMLFNTEPDKITTIWDATYIYTEKSGNHDFQRHSFNAQKNRNFVKPMMITTTDGTIIDLLGPYKAVTNDADIMQYIFERNNDVQQIFQPGDSFILDRGFRDVKPMLDGLGYKVYMPDFILRKDPKGQLPTEKANKSRLVTKCRWVVEARNGHLKSVWAIFGKRWTTKYLRYLTDDMRIAAALLNKFYEKIHVDKDNYVEVANQMIERIDRPNKLSKIVDRQRFQNEVHNFQEIDTNDFFFPNLSENDLKTVSQGVYQLKLSSAYCADTIKKRDRMKILMCPTDICNRLLADIIAENQMFEPVLLLSLVQSRDTSGRVYRPYILADVTVAGANCVVEYVCECKHGLRTVGCCSHVMCVLWFLGLGRFLPEIKGPSAHLDKVYQ